MVGICFAKSCLIADDESWFCLSLSESDSRAIFVSCLVFLFCRLNNNLDLFNNILIVHYVTFLKLNCSTFAKHR